MQPDGKIVVGGSFTEIGGIERKYIARLNEDGTLDESFAADANAYVESLVLQSDGKIVLGGFTEINGTVRKYSCADQLIALHGDGLDRAIRIHGKSVIDAILARPSSLANLKP